MPETSSQTSKHRTLQQRFDALQAHRVAAMDPDALCLNAEQRRQLVGTTDRARLVRAAARLSSTSDA